MEFSNSKIIQYNFQKRVPKDVDWVNGGYFVCEQSIFNYVK